MTVIAALYILAAVCFVLAAALVLVCVLYRRERRACETLANSIEKFEDEGSMTEYSTADDRFSRLQNNVCDLENRLTVEKNNTRLALRRNAEFISDVSHQLKTPLAGIRFYCEMLQTESPTSYGEKELTLIEHMESLIYHLLRLEKLLSDAYVMEFETQDMRVLIGALLADFRPLFPKKRYSISGTGKMRCDRAWISEAISNLLKNAAEHTAEDGTIQVLLEQGDRALTVTVEDDGGGVPDEQLPMLFTRFFKAESGPSGSAGIGLAITKAVVEKHHGTISAENGVKGLKVILCFPFVEGILPV